MIIFGLIPAIVLHFLSFLSDIIFEDNIFVHAGAFTNKLLGQNKSGFGPGMENVMRSTECNSVAAFSECS